MKFYDSIGPNPAVVRDVLAYKGLTPETVTVDIVRGDNRAEDFTRRNPTGTTPALELDDGTFLSEITAIAEYLEELQPSPALIGTTATERAETRMWVRRIDIAVLEPLLNGFRATGGRRMFESRLKIVSKEAGAELIDIARDRAAWLDKTMAGRTWVCGDRYTLADIMLYDFLSFAAAPPVRAPLADQGEWLPGWFARAAERQGKPG